MSYFNSESVAEGYATNRPYFHPLVMNKIRDYLHLGSKVKSALDVGCGAGLSTIALLELADKVIGVDSSQEMIDAAIQKENVRYYLSRAEDLVFPNGIFQLITLCGAINWIDRSRFFPSARRILTPSGWIIVYDNVFCGQIREEPAFAEWFAQEFLSRYPKPPRDERPLTEAECAEFGYRFSYSEDYENGISYSREEFVDYLMTQSNISVALAREMETAEGIRAWLAKSLVPFFDRDRRTLVYSGYIWYLQSL